MRLEERTEAGDTAMVSNTAMVANTAVRDNVNRVVTIGTVLEMTVSLPVWIAVNAANVNAAAIGHYFRVG